MYRKLSLVILIVIGFSSEINCTLKQSHTFRHHQRSVGGQIHRTTEIPVTPEEKLIEVVKNPGEDAILLCDIENKTLKEHVKWFHDGVEVDFIHRYVKDAHYAKLTINNVRLEDGGIWRCEDRDGRTAKLPIHLVVLDKPRVPYLLIDGRRLDPGNLFIPIKENNNFSVECVVEGGNPSPKLRWMLQPRVNKAVKPTVTSVPGIQVTNESTSTEGRTKVFRSEAKLPKVLRKHHNATISCVVSHVTLHTPLNASILLDVEYMPSFGIGRDPAFGIPILEGIPVWLKCDVDSNPPSYPIWQKDNGTPPVEQTIDGYLNFSSITLKDAGWYKCSSRYYQDEYSSIGYYLNVRTGGDEQLEIVADEPTEKVVQEIEVTLGGEVQLECPTGSVTCWGRSKFPNQHIEALGAGPTLLLGNVVYQEAGQYKCFSGKHPKMEKWKSRTIQVNVVGSPVVYPANKTLTVITDQRVSISLEFCANPAATKTFWIWDTISLTPGATYGNLIAHNITESNNKYCKKAELTIESTRKNNSGEYLFIVMSEKGIASSTITLNVTTTSVLSMEGTIFNKSPSIPPIRILTTIFFIYFLLKIT